MDEGTSGLGVVFAQDGEDGFRAVGSGFDLGDGGLESFDGVGGRFLFAGGHNYISAMLWVVIFTLSRHAQHTLKH